MRAPVLLSLSVNAADGGATAYVATAVIALRSNGTAESAANGDKGRGRRGGSMAAPRAATLEPQEVNSKGFYAATTATIVPLCTCLVRELRIAQHGGVLLSEI